MSGNNEQGKPMTGDAAARIQSATARGGGDMSSGGFPARAQSAAAHNENAGNTSNTTNQGGSNTGSNQEKK
ncbi:hypothetical protein F5Y08DRAFT_347812 [Xylaria arbuscula]|nr:hypothetical protein F5Y08DRAFT_347812 [Xylaria arbuscula]